MKLCHPILHVLNLWLIVDVKLISQSNNLHKAYLVTDHTKDLNNSSLVISKTLLTAQLDDFDFI